MITIKIKALINNDTLYIILYEFIRIINCCVFNKINNTNINIYCVIFILLFLFFFFLDIDLELFIEYSSIILYYI